MKELIIQKNEAGQRFDKYLKKLLCNAGSSFIYKMLRKKNITLNDKKADGTEKLNQNDCVKLFFSDETYLKFTNSDTTSFTEKLPSVDLNHLPFEVLLETENLLIIDKPSGMLSQKAKPEDVSANEYILSYLIAKKAITTEELKTFRPSICNRLDRNTSGILIAGKTLNGLQQMAECLKERTVKKYYYAIVSGQVKESSYLKGYLQKDTHKNQVQILSKPLSEEAKPIETEYEPLYVSENATLLKVHLITGRSHQIRAHLASIHHPIIGDSKYGNSKVNDIYRRKFQIDSQLLHAKTLVFDSFEVSAKLPDTFVKILESEKFTCLHGTPEDLEALHWKNL